MSEVTPAGTVSTFASGFNDPVSLAFDAAGNLYVGSGEVHTVDKVTTAGKISIFVSGFTSPTRLKFDSSGNLFIADGGSTVSEVTPAGTVSTLVSGLNAPDGLAFDAAGDLFVANGGDGTVVKLIDTVAVPFTLGGTAASGKDYSGVTASPLTFGIGQTTVNITGKLRSDPGLDRTLTFTLGTPTGGAVLGSPSVNTLTIAEPASVQFSTGRETVSQNTGTFSIPVTITGTPNGTSTVSPFASGFDEPVGLAVNAAGNLYVANTSNGTVDKVTPTGEINIIASGFDDPYGLAFDAAGNVFVSTAGDGKVFKVTPAGLVTTFATGFDDPFSLAFDAAGNLYVADLSSSTVSEVTPAGTVSTFASGFDVPDGLAFDAAGKLFVANAGNGTVSVVNPTGVVSPFASGFNEPVGLAFDAAGDLYVANANNDTVSEVNPAGAINTLASGFNNPEGLALDGGRLYVVNHGDNTLSQVTDAVTVPFTLGGTAVSGKDYSGVTASPLTFAIGQTIQDITGTFLPDPGPNQTLTFTLGTPTGGVALGSPSVNTMTITQQAVVEFSTDGETVSSAEGTFSIPVTLSGGPSVSTYADGLHNPMAWPSTPPATSSSPTPATAR